MNPEQIEALAEAFRDSYADDPSTLEESPFQPVQDHEADVMTSAGAGQAERGSFEERFRSRRVDLLARLDHGIPPLDYLPASDRLLVRGKRHILPAPKKTGKSLGMLVHWVDMILAGGRVTILDRENGADLYAARLGAIAASRGLNDEQRAKLRDGLYYYEFPRVRDYDRADLVAELAGADVVVFDGQRRFLSDLGLDEDKSDDYAKFMDAAIDPLFEAGIATLILDNTGHEESKRARGTSAKEDLNEVAFTLETVEPYSDRRLGKIRLRLEPGRSRFGSEGTWEMTIGAGVYGGWELVSLEDAVTEDREHKQEDARTWIIAHVNEHPGASKEEVAVAYQEYAGRGGRVLARRVIDSLLAASGTASNLPLAKGPGPAANGIYLYPASTLSSPLAEPPTASTEK